MSKAAIILAAGASSRFGQPKQDLLLHGETLIQRSCRVALEADCSPVLLVVRDDLPIKVVLPPKIEILINPRWREGMGTSLALAASHLLVAGHSPGAADSTFILLADQVAIEARHLLELAAAIAPPITTIALSEDDGVSGPPACFERKHLTSLSQLHGDQGGKEIVRQHPSEVAAIPIPEARWDIDTPRRWKQFISQSSQP